MRSLLCQLIISHQSGLVSVYVYPRTDTRQDCIKLFFDTLTEVTLSELSGDVLSAGGYNFPSKVILQEM